MTRLAANLKAHRYFLLTYGAIYAIFLWPLLIFKRTFIYGDYWQQHYPWSFEYARLLKTGSLPYWVPQVSSGLPLVAEGQVGAYYPLHLILYAVLPVFAAYTIGILLHVLVGGVGFYVYGRRSQLSEEASSWLAILFSFSSAYGGCFSNTAVLRVMAWLPWCLLIWQKLIASKGHVKFRWISLLSFLFFMMGTAGASQMAVYAVIYMTLLCLWTSKGKGWLEWMAAGALAVALSAPQWLATLELMQVSTRTGESAAFSLWGSVLPPGLVSVLFPQWGMFLGAAFYVSAAGLLVTAITFASKKCQLEKIHLWLVVLFILISLGSYGPFFWLSFGFFRNPSKWLFFSTVSLSVVIAFSLDRVRKAPLDLVGLREAFRKNIVFVCVAVAALPLSAQVFYAVFQDRIRLFALKSAGAAFAGKKDPFHNLPHYQQKAAELVARIEGLISYQNIWNLAAIGLFVVSGFILWKALHREPKRFWLRWALPIVAIADLTLFGSYIGAGFTGNARDFPKPLDEKIVSSVRSRQWEGQSLLASWADANSLEYLPANTNLLYGVGHAGGYTPLMIKRYYELTKELGIVDSSLGRRAYDPEVWRRENALVRALGIGQILTADGLKAVEDPAPFFWTVNDWRVIADESQRLSYLKGESFEPAISAVLEEELPGFERHPEGAPAQVRVLSWGSMDISLEADNAYDTLLIFRSANYPGWIAEVDGRQTSVLAVNHAFSGVALKAGHHAVRFYYDTRRHRVWEAIAALVLLVLMGTNYLLWRRRAA